MNDDFYKKVYDIVSKIPKGKVTTYGEIAYLVNKPKNARQVGYALRVLEPGHGLPCHRVVNSLGELSPNYVFGQGKQKELLEKEGVQFLENNRVDMKKYFWKNI